MTVLLRFFIRMTRDFDYIGTGGFLLECMDGEILGITKEQALIIRKESPFFDNCFRHGTVETSEGVLRKPDWPIGIARHIIEVLVKGKTTVPNLQLFQQLIDAGDQACMDLRLCSMVNYIDPLPSRESRAKFLELVDDEHFCFNFRGNVKSNEWLELLEEGVLLNRKDTNYVVQLCNDEAPNSGSTTPRTLAARRKLDTKVSDFVVHAHRTLDAVLQIQSTICSTVKANCTWPPPDEPDQFSIYFETSKPVPKDHMELIDRLGGGEAFVRTCGDASESKSTEGYTITGSFDLLLRALKHIVPIPLVDENVECSLRIDNPSPDTLGRFINACQKAQDYPSTLGMDAMMGRYFCRKTVYDIHSMLTYLADFSTKSNVEGNFTIFELSSEDKPF
eukprot:scaffold3170_cov128-Cylindrotheca_fusiformis.AAC.5